MFLIKWPPLPVYVCFSDGHGHFVLKKEYKDSRYFTLKYQSYAITSIKNIIIQYSILWINTTQKLFLSFGKFQQKVDSSSLVMYCIYQPSNKKSNEFDIWHVWQWSGWHWTPIFAMCFVLYWWWTIVMIMTMTLDILCLLPHLLKIL